jgi:hypothetical protein
MYVCDVKLDVLLASKNGQPFKILVSIRMKKDDDGTARWGYLGDHDYRMPTGGPFRRQGGDVILQDTEGKDYALLSGFGEPPAQGAVGGIQIYPPPTTFGGGSVYAPQGAMGAPMKAQPGVRPTYAGTAIAWRGSGKWTLLKSDTIAGVTQNTWNAFCNNITQSATEWFIKTTAGFSGSVGCGVGWEYMNGVLVMNSDMKKGEEFRLYYKAHGWSVMTPGVGGTASAEWTPCTGSYIIRGPLPTPNPFHPRQLAGPCVIVEVAGTKTFLPVPGAEVLDTGVGAYGTLFFFGTQGGPANPLFSNYKAACGVAGLTGAVNILGKGSASMNISWGTMTTA